MEDVVAGIDVGKWRLDVSVSQGPVRSFDNTPEGIAALASWVASRGASEAVCEPTGYEREVVRRLRESGLPVHVAHPNKVRNFARAAGYEGRPTCWTRECSRAMERCSNWPVGCPMTEMVRS